MNPEECQREALGMRIRQIVAQVENRYLSAGQGGAEIERVLDERLRTLSAENEALSLRNADVSMLAHRWMVAHDRLQAGKPYDFPAPADLPNAIAERDALRAEVRTLAAERDEEYRQAAQLRAGLEEADNDRDRLEAQRDALQSRLLKAVEGLKHIADGNWNKGRPVSRSNTVRNYARAILQSIEAESGTRAAATPAPKPYWYDSGLTFAEAMARAEEDRDEPDAEGGE